MRIELGCVTPRVFPVTLAPNNLKSLRVIGTPNLGFNPQTVASTEIRSDAQLEDLSLVGGEAGGDIDFEWSYGVIDDLIESSLFSAWVNTPAKAGPTGITTIRLVSSNTAITLDSAADFKANHIIRLTGVADVGQGIYRITSIASNVLTCAPLNSSTSQVSGNTTGTAAHRVAVVGLNGATGITVAGGQLQVTGPSGFFSDAMGDGSNLAAGQWVKVAGLASAANNVWVRITAATATTLTGLAPTGATTQTATGINVFFGDYVRNGVVSVMNHTYLVERRYADHPTEGREAFIGFVPDTLSLDLEPQAIATGKVVFFGESAKASTTVTEIYNSAPSDIPAPDNDVLNTSSNVGRIGAGANPASVAGGVNAVLGAQISIASNLRRKPAVGVLGSTGTGRGSLNLTGTLRTYFDNLTLLNQLLDNEESSFDISLRDASGRALLIDLPRIKWSSGAPEVTGQNTDVVLPLGFQALRHKTFGYTIHAQRFGFAG